MKRYSNKEGMMVESPDGGWVQYEMDVEKAAPDYCGGGIKINPEELEELIPYYVSIQTTLGFYRGRNDEASQKDLDLFSTAILNQEVGVLKLGNNNEDMFFGEEITANSVITIHYINKDIPF